MRAVASLFLLLGLCMGFASQAWALPSDLKIPALTGPVVDGAGLLKPEELAELTRLAQALNATKKIQLAVLITDSLQDHDIESYSLAVAEAWKLGKKKVDNGLLIVLAPKEHKLRFEVGYGLEGDLTDVQTKRIQLQTMTPYFRAGDYFAGMRSGIIHVAQELHLEQTAPDFQRRQGADQGMPLWFMILLVVMFIALSRVPGFWLIVFSLLNSGGGGRRGSDGFGGGGGGFSGGGGGFGGGGSSSSW